MATTKSRTAKKTSSKKVAGKKSPKPRTIKVVGEGSEDGTDVASTETKPTKKTRKKAAGPTEKRMSAIDAAAKVLAETGEPMNAKQLIDTIVSGGYWTSPAGKTPHATLYSAILREISAKGANSRFKKTERGKFATNG
jgi:hypothetical protein